MDIFAKLLVDILLSVALEQAVISIEPATNITAQLLYTKKEFAIIGG